MKNTKFDNHKKDEKSTIRINAEMKKFIFRKGLSVQKIIDNWLKRNFKKNK